jgi:hypothetical protein
MSLKKDIGCFLKWLRLFGNKSSCLKKKSPLKRELRNRNLKPQNAQRVLTIVPPHVAVTKERPAPFEPNARQQPPATDADTNDIFKHNATTRDRIERCKGCHKKILPGGCAAGSGRVEIFLCAGVANPCGFLFRTPVTLCYV